MNTKTHTDWKSKSILLDFSMHFHKYMATFQNTLVVKCNLEICLVHMWEHLCLSLYLCFSSGTVLGWGPLHTRTVISKDSFIKRRLCQRTVISKDEIHSPRWKQHIQHNSWKRKKTKFSYASKDEGDSQESLNKSVHRREYRQKLGKQKSIFNRMLNNIIIVKPTKNNIFSLSFVLNVRVELFWNYGLKCFQKKPGSCILW